MSHYKASELIAALEQRKTLVYSDPFMKIKIKGNVASTGGIELFIDPDPVHLATAKALMWMNSDLYWIIVKHPQQWTIE